MLDVSNVISGIGILVKFIKAYDNFFAEPICFYFNKSLENGKFTNWLKLAIITPVFTYIKNNFRPVRILPFFQRHSKGYLVDSF